MKGRKMILLLIALLLPSAIFVFLRTFGRNEFNVEPLFQSGVPAGAGCPGYSYPVPYAIPDSLLRFGSVGLGLFVFDGANAAVVSSRVRPSYDSTSVAIISQAPNSRVSKCVFLIKEPVDLVVVDKTGTIRGQYDSHDREEVDRLITELAILLKRY